MKKYIAGFLAGALFTIAGAAFADDIQTLIGKKIQGEAVVELNGQALDNAIIVDGKSYAPVRSIGEAAGYEVSMQNKKITLGQKEATTTPGKGQSVEDQKEKLSERIASQKQRIAETEQLLSGMIEETKKPGYADKGEQVFINNYNKRLTEQNTLLADLESQLAALK